MTRPMPNLPKWDWGVPVRREKRAMKARRVVVTLEIETDVPLSDLRRVDCWQDASGEPWEWSDTATVHTVHQVQANVIRPTRKGKAAGKRGAK